jgi:hypothetical protein
MVEIHQGKAYGNEKVFKGVHGKGQRIVGVAVFKVRIEIVAISVASIHDRNEK